MKFTIFLSFIATVIFTSGCSLKSSQLSSIYSWLSESKLEFEDHAWVLQYANYERIVYAVNLDDYVLFSNESGDQILFDGWKIIKLKGLANASFNTEPENQNTRCCSLTSSWRVKKRSCQNWVREEQDKYEKYTQICGTDYQYKNSILLDGKQNIIMIRQFIDQNDTPLTITKLHYYNGN